MRGLCLGILRKSSNGRRAVSKTVNVGSIPAFRAIPSGNVTKIASILTLTQVKAGMLMRENIK